MRDEIKEYLRISWDEDDKVLDMHIAQGIAYLDDLVSEPINFEQDQVAKCILFNYLRYAYNNAIEDFEDNFKSNILKLQIKYGAKDLEND